MTCFTLRDRGWCAFCGNDEPLFRLLFDSPLRAVAICDRCVLSGCDVLGKLLSSLRGRAPGFDVPPPYYEADFQRRVTAIVDDLAAEAVQRPHDGCCSFCSSTTTAHLFGGPDAYICERCIERCCRDITVEPTALDDALVAAFPGETIDRGMIDEPSALWDAYPEYADLGPFEGKTWRALPSSLLLRHPSLLGCAGDRFFHAVLPAYLRYVLHEQTALDVPRVLASSHPSFERRISAMTPEQRASMDEVLRSALHLRL